MVASLSTAASAQTLLQYAFTGSSLNPTTTGANVSGNTMNITGSSLVSPTGFNVQTSLGYASQPVLLAQQTTGTAATTAAAAIANNVYFQFTVTPTTGFSMNLSSLTFDAARGGAGTPRGYAVLSNVDNFTATLGTADVTTVRTTLANYSVTLGGASFTNLTAPTTFRFYMYMPGLNNSLEFDNITLNGTTTAVTGAAAPEPASLALGALPFAPMAAVRYRYHRRRRAAS